MHEVRKGEGKMLEINKIHLGDSYELIKQIPDKSIDLVIIDPPYLIDYKTNYRKDKTHDFCSAIENDSNSYLIEYIIPELHRVLKDNTAIYAFTSPDTIDFFKSLIDKYFKIKNIIIWVKNNWTAGDLEAQYGKQYEMCVYANKGRCFINGKRVTDVWIAAEEMGLNRVAGNLQTHQNEKPLELIKKMIINSSQPNDLVLDCFSGSGTTCVAAKELNRRFIGIEIDPRYHKISVDRLNGITTSGQTSIFTDFESESLL